MRALKAGLVALLLPHGVSAQCNFEVGFYGVDDREILQTFRCLNNEILRLRRDQARLERQVGDMERLLAELPAEYTNLDGKVTEEPDRVIDRARFVLTGRPTGSASALPIAQPVLNEVCGRPGGCTVTLIFRQSTLLESETRETLLTGPCRFAYEVKTGAWALGRGCDAGGAASGVDGDQMALSGEGGGEVIVQSGGACLLAESDIALSPDGDGLALDRGRGLYLLSVPARQPDAIRRFECDLVMD